MTTRHRKILSFVVCIAIMTLVGQAWAGVHPRLEGRLSQPDAMVVSPRASVTVPMGEGLVRLETGALRLARGGPEGGFLRVAAAALTPGSRYMVLTGREPVHAFTADPNGRYSARVTDQIQINGTVMVRHSGRPFSSGLTDLRVVDLSSGATGNVRLKRAGDGEPVDAGSISICRANDYMTIGWMDWVIFDDGLQTAMVSAIELPPDVPVGVAFDSIFIGTAPTNDLGELFVVFSSDPAPGELPLPSTALPLDEVQTVDLTSVGLVLGSGTNGEECDWIEPPLPVDEDITNLCPDEDGDPGQRGFAGWTVWDDGNEDFFIHVGGLEPEQVLSLVVDGHDLGAFTATEWGDLGLIFTSNPGGGRDRPIIGDVLPLPDEIRPVSEIDLVSLGYGDVTVVEGSFANGCDLPEPPHPVDQDFTNLCPVDSDDLAWGQTGWLVWDDATEEFFVDVIGLEPQSSWNLIVDGHDLGAFTASERGELALYFSSNPDGGGGPGRQLDVLDLPDEIRPVSSINLVSLVSMDGAPVVEGSFADGCDSPEPPEPVDEDYTDLCPVDSNSFASGEAGWLMWDDGTEEFFVGVFGLDPDSSWNLIVDGHDLGAFTASNWGEFTLFFSSNPDGGGPGRHSDLDVLDLPDEIRPVSSINLVSLVSMDGAPVVEGSFADGCDSPEPPEPVDEGYTDLCPVTAEMAMGEVAWIEWDDGTEQLMLAVYPVEPEATYQIIVDGLDLGGFEADREGHLWVDFSSNPVFPGQVLLPETVRPVSAIDIVEIRDSQDAAIVAGSFSEPCSMEWEYEADYTGLCDTEGPQSGDSWWWISTLNGHVLEESFWAVFWEGEAGMTYSVEVDGLNIGEMVPAEGWGGPVLVLSLGQHNQPPVPDELSPISGIDIVRILNENGLQVAAGSYSDPCSQPGDGGNDPTNRQEQIPAD